MQRVTQWQQKQGPGLSSKVVLPLMLSSLPHLQHLSLNLLHVVLVVTDISRSTSPTKIGILVLMRIVERLETLHQIFFSLICPVQPLTTVTLTQSAIKLSTVQWHLRYRAQLPVVVIFSKPMAPYLWKRFLYQRLPQLKRASHFFGAIYCTLPTLVTHYLICQIQTQYYDLVANYR